MTRFNISITINTRRLYLALSLKYVIGGYTKTYTRRSRSKYTLYLHGNVLVFRTSIFLRCGKDYGS